jgi:hypothetical protein
MYTFYMEQQPDQTKELSEMRKALNKLEDYAKKGFLFHGSKKRLAILEPRQANDSQPGKETIGNLNAVYALDTFRVPILAALMDEKDKSIGGWKRELSDDGTTLIVGGENFTFTNGYVHVLPPDNFKTEEHDGNYEIVSYTAVTPTDAVEVRPSIVNLLPNVVVHESR